MPGLGRFPGEGNGNPLQYSCLENPMDREPAAGYCPLGHKESDTTERLHFHFHNEDEREKERGKDPKKEGRDGGRNKGKEGKGKRRNEGGGRQGEREGKPVCDGVGIPLIWQIYVTSCS